MTDEEIKRIRDENRHYAVFAIVSFIPILLMVVLFFVGAALSAGGEP